MKRTRRIEQGDKFFIEANMKAEFLALPLQGDEHAIFSAPQARKIAKLTGSDAYYDFQQVLLVADVADQFREFLYVDLAGLEDFFVRFKTPAARCLSGLQLSELPDLNSGYTVDPHHFAGDHWCWQHDDDGRAWLPRAEEFTQCLPTYRFPWAPDRKLIFGDHWFELTDFVMERTELRTLMMEYCSEGDLPK